MGLDSRSRSVRLGFDDPLDHHSLPRLRVPFTYTTKKDTVSRVLGGAYGTRTHDLYTASVAL